MVRIPRLEFDAVSYPRNGNLARRSQAMANRVLPRDLWVVPVLPDVIVLALPGHRWTITPNDS